MNITRQQKDELNAVVTLKLGEEDYSGKVENVLSEYRRKARIDGFRPGKVPMGIIRKLYFKPVLADEINRMVGEELMKYLQNEKIQILGEPLPVENHEKIDFETAKDFEFSFEVGIAPELEAEVGEKDKIPFYTIKVDDKILDEQIQDLSKRFGNFIASDAVAGDELLKGDLTECDKKGNPVESGVHAPDIAMSLNIIKEESAKKPFLGKKAGDKIVFDLKKAYPSNVEIASLLKVDKEKVAELSEYFILDLKEVMKFTNHEINQELFDEVYGKDQVKTEEEFRNRIAEEMKGNYERESNYRFTLDARDFYLGKTNVKLPVDFLKRWLVEVNDKLTTENIDEEFKSYEEEFKWQLLRGKMVKAYDIAVNDQELFEYAFFMARNQFYQYGLHNMPEEYIEKFAREQLEKPEEARRLKDQLLDEKVFRYIKDHVKLDKKEISLEKFRKLFDK